MSIISADCITPLHSSRCRLQNACTFRTPVTEEDVVTNSFIQNALLSEESAHYFLTRSFFVPFVNGTNPFTMTGVIQRVGNIVNFVWNNVNLVGANTAPSGILDLDTNEFLSNAGNTASGNFTIRDATDPVTRNGRIVIDSTGTVTLYADEGWTSFSEGHDYTIRGQTLAWPTS